MEGGTSAGGGEAGPGPGLCLSHDSPGHRGAPDWGPAWLLEGKEEGIEETGLY